MPHSRVADQFDDESNVDRLELDPTNPAPVDLTDPNLTDEDRETLRVERESKVDEDDKEVPSSPGTNSSESSKKPARSPKTK